MVRIVGGAVLMLMSLIVVGCGQSALPPGGAATHAAEQVVLPAEEPGIVGSITNVGMVDGPANVRGLIRIEQNPAEETSPKDEVKITDSTRLISQKGQDLHTAAFADLKVGQQVKAWYDGPVAESFPRQATARVVLLLDPQATQ